MGPIPMQPAASLPQTEGWVCVCEGRVRKRGSSRKTERGLRGKLLR